MSDKTINEIDSTIESICEFLRERSYPEPEKTVSLWKSPTIKQLHNRPRAVDYIPGWFSSCGSFFLVV